MNKIEKMRNEIVEKCDEAYIKMQEAEAAEYNDDNNQKFLLYRAQVKTYEDDLAIIDVNLNGGAWVDVKIASMGKWCCANCRMISERLNSNGEVVDRMCGMTFGESFPRKIENHYETPSWCPAYPKPEDGNHRREYIPENGDKTFEHDPQSKMRDRGKEIKIPECLEDDKNEY